MPWKEASPMDQRTQFIADHLRDTLSITELCELYGISRKTGYKWIDRYLRQGPAGLEERSRRPQRSPNATSEEIVAAILEVGRQEAVGPAAQAASAVGPARPLDGLRYPAPAREGAAAAPAPAPRPPGKTDEPDSRPQRRLECGLQRPVPDRRRSLLLSADRRRWVQPLSARLPGPAVDGGGRGQADLHAAVPGVRTATTDSQRQRRAVRHHHTGPLVEAVGVVDPPRHSASSSSPDGLTGTAGTSECTGPSRRRPRGPAAGSLAAQQRRFNVFREEFNHERPHEALDQETPAAAMKRPRARCRTGCRRWNTRIGSRCGTSAPTAAFGGRAAGSTSPPSVGEYVGLEEIDDGLWNVYFGPLRLGRLSERHMRIEDEYGKLYRRHV